MDALIGSISIVPGGLLGHFLCAIPAVFAFPFPASSDSSSYSAPAAAPTLELIEQMANDAPCYVMRFDKSGEIAGELRRCLDRRWED